MHRNAVTPLPGDAAAMLVSCDLVVFTLVDGQLRVLIEAGEETVDAGRFALPRVMIREGESPEASVLRLSEQLGLPGDSHPHQVGVFGDPRRDPAGRVLGVGWLLCRPEGWTVPVGFVLCSLDEAADAGLDFDHSEVLEAAVRKLGDDLETTLLATEFCAEPFTLAQLRAVYEEVWQVRLDAANFHRKFTNLPGVLEPTGEQTRGARGRPATLYRAGTREQMPQRMSRPDSNGSTD